tara:strand:- start:1385 stop:2464 length:1080 start_codon:yes stop_codon:yes gene_type:complete
MNVIFLNSHRAKSGILNGEILPQPYVLASKFFDCGIIDRTHTLDVGFSQKVVDEIPAIDPGFSLSFADICDLTAKGLIEESQEKGMKIQVLWSGGIDSTVALIALLKNLDPEEYSRLEVTLSLASIDEYPLFFRRHILNKLSFKLINPPISNHFGNMALIVTGEHGDQLFGSDKLLPLIDNGLAGENYEDIWPLYLMNQFGRAKRVDMIVNYLQPLIQACPVPIVSTFDLYWWLNFTVKWQQVSMRMAAFSFAKDLGSLQSRVRHFFRNDQFQQWSLKFHPQRAVTSLKDYKLPAKEYIFDFTDDPEYLDHKTKEASLKHVIINRNKQGNHRYRMVMDENYHAVAEIFHRRFINKNIVS